jgi:hypothetical protein
MLFGTKPDAEITARELASKPYIIRKGHGFLAAAPTMDEAGRLSVRVHRRALELGKGAPK